MIPKLKVLAVSVALGMSLIAYASVAQTTQGSGSMGGMQGQSMGNMSGMSQGDMQKMMSNCPEMMKNSQPGASSSASAPTSAPGTMQMSGDMQKMHDDCMKMMGQNKESSPMEGEKKD